MIAKNYVTGLVSEIIQNQFESNKAMNVSNPDIINFSVDFEDIFSSKKGKELMMDDGLNYDDSDFFKIVNE